MEKDNLLAKVIHNPILVFSIMLHDVYQIVSTFKKTSISMPHTLDYFDIGLKLFLCIYVYTILKKYNRIKELLQVARQSQLFHAYRSHTDSIVASKQDINSIMQKYQAEEKTALKKRLQRIYPSKSDKELEQLIHEYYQG